MLKRRAPEYNVDYNNVVLSKTPIVDGDAFVYSIGLAAQYTLRHFYLVGEDPEVTTPVATFRYVKKYRGVSGYKDWLKFCDFELDTDVFFVEEEFLDTIDKVLHSVKVTMMKFQGMFGHKPKIYLTGVNNFREDIAFEVPYKGNRWTSERREEEREIGKWSEWLEETKDSWREPQRPKHKEAIIEYLVERWGATVVDGMEADDAVSMEMWADWYAAQDPQEDNTKNVLVHIDKDLNMVPGWHYNPDKEELYFTDEFEASRFFYKQLLVGDKQTDNIPGLTGVGDRTAEKLLAGCTTEEEMDAIIFHTYQNHKDMTGKDDDQIIEIIQNRAFLLWMYRSVEEIDEVKDYYGI